MRIATISAIAAGLLLTGCNQGPGVDAAALQHVIDRAAIEDLMNDYYANFGGSSNEDFLKFYTQDATFDVNGLVYHGPKEIMSLYDTLGDQDALPPGTFHMLVTNPQIQIDGDSATVKVLWTGVMNDKIDGPPHFQEQGREYDLLVRQDGKWLIKKRVVIADSGLPSLFKATYTPRKDFDVTKED